jgi:DNA replication protein DnaC
MSKIINIFGGPGIGKSSIAAGITYKLKKNQILH